MEIDIMGKTSTKDSNKGCKNLKGPDTNASVPFRNGAPPFQCYNCGGWGHRLLVPIPDHHTKISTLSLIYENVVIQTH